VCIFIFLLGYSSIKALATSQVLIFGGSLVASLMKMTYQHPFYKNAPLIHYDLVAYISGALVAGSSIGAFLTRVLQSWISISGLVVLVWVIAYATLKKAANMYRQEAQKHNTSEECADLEDSKDMKERLPLPYSLSKALICLTLCILLSISLIRGDSAFHSIVGIEYCSVSYFVVTAAYFVAVLLQTICTGVHLYKKYRNRIDCFDSFSFTKRNMIMLPLLTFVTGVLAGSLGIGGGLILNPVFIVYGMHPEVSTASCNVFVLMTSLSSFVQFYMAGLIDREDAIILFVVSLVGSAIGIFIIRRIVQKYKRDSILVFLLGGSMVVVGIIIPTNLISQILTHIENGTLTAKLRSVC
jgi:uncharacterized membrane protein YfcA